MEKFAVDLEKVLDEFEYNEEREENVSASSIKNPPIQQLGIGVHRQLPPARPPAANYRRPSFEPINLADANFAASPPKSSNPNFNLQTDNGETFPFPNSKSQLNNRHYVHVDSSIVSALNNEVNINKQIIIESGDTHSKIWENPNSSLPNEEKPDLLEYNSTSSNLDSDNLENHNQLPDITTSVRALGHSGNNNDIIDNLSNSLDLISSTSGNLITEYAEENVSHVVQSSYESLVVESTELPNKLLSECTLLAGSIETDNLNQLSTQLDSDSVCPVDIRNSEGGSLLNPNQEENHVQNSDCTIELASKINQNQTKSILYDSSCERQKSTVPLQEAKSKENVMQLEVVINDFQDDIILPEKPIGFDNGSDVSESELEEYLKELEVLDESYSCENKTSNINNVHDEHCTETEEDCAMKDDTTAKFVSGDNNHKQEETELYIANSNSSSVPNSSKINSVPENILSLHLKNSSTCITEISNMSTSASEVEAIKDKSHGSLQINEEHESKNASNFTSEELSTSEDENELDKAVNVPVKNINQPSEINTFDANVNYVTCNPEQKVGNEKSRNRSLNPFHQQNCNSLNKKKEDAEKSTNPFENDDDEEKGVLSQCYDYSLVESKRKSTNPFENDEDNDIGAAFLDNNVETLSKSCVTEGKNEIEKNVEEVNTIQDSSLILNSDVTEETFKDSVANQSLKVSQSEVSNLLEQGNNFEQNNTILENNFSTESLPSCSNIYTEHLDNSLDSTARMIPIKQAIESPMAHCVDEAGIAAEEDKPLRPNSLELPRKITVETSTLQSPNSGEFERELGPEDRRLGKVPPFWIPDTDTTMCMQCQLKFNVIKRRHHCRACGQVLCYKCCGLKARLEYMNFTEARVCQPCFTILEAVNASESTSPLAGRQPNPNNPMEYCSTIPPLQQAAGSLHQPPPSVMVPVGVLKREGRIKSDVTKQVMFSDGIRPGGDLTELDGSGEPRMPFRRPGRLTKRVGTPPGGILSPSMRRVMDPTTQSFIPSEGDSSLPPVVSRLQGEVSYSDFESPIGLNQPTVKFALNRNLFVLVKRVLLDCCVNRECWCFSSEGLACVGQDEIVFLLECLPQETLPPKDVFLLINFLYQDAAKGSTVSEMSFTPAISSNLLGSRDHGGFLYIRTSYQCTAQLVLPSPPYLVALLIHRWETPWARLFPIRLVLRLGAEFRYYPCPLVSVRNRPPLYTDIGHTIINILADFRKYTYTLPSVRGLLIHMEDRQTTINIPRNRYDQVVRALNNSNDSVLAFGANLSLAADSHLVCMQSIEDENTSYNTQAINIHNKPRRVTGASFVVFNGALKVPGLAGKSNIVEDGLMVQVPSETMVTLRTALRDMRDYTIGCGPNSEETVVLQWTADDTNFNIGVKSCIDGKALDGVPSIRVHNGTDYSGGTRIIRWTEVFILQCEDSEHSSEPLDISRLSESIARATCLALVPLLDLLSAASLTTLAVRTTIHPDNVGYEAGSNGEKLPPLYMKSLDDELVAVVHQAALASQDNPAVLELVFRIMEQG